MTVIDNGVDAMAGSVLPGHQAGPCGGTIGGAGVCLLENQAFFGQSIDIGGRCQVASGKTDIFPSHVIDQDKNEVRAIRSLEGKWNDKETEKIP